MLKSINSIYQSSNSKKHLGFLLFFLVLWHHQSQAQDDVMMMEEEVMEVEVEYTQEEIEKEKAIPADEYIARMLLDDIIEYEHLFSWYHVNNQKYVVVFNEMYKLGIPEKGTKQLYVTDNGVSESYINTVKNIFAKKVEKPQRAIYWIHFDEEGNISESKVAFSDDIARAYRMRLKPFQVGEKAEILYDDFYKETEVDIIDHWTFVKYPCMTVQVGYGTKKVIDQQKGKYLSSYHNAKLYPIGDQAFDKNHMIVLRGVVNGKYGVVDPYYNILIPFEYDEIGDFQGMGDKSYAPVKKEGKYGIMDQNGTMLFDAEYEATGYFRNNKLELKKDGKYGIVNLKKEIILPFEYDSIVNRNRHNYTVVKDAKWGIVSKANEVLLPFEYDVLEKIHWIDINAEDALLKFKQDNKWGMVTSKGKVIHKAISDRYFMHGIAAESNSKRTLFVFEQDKKFGLLDTEGNILNEAKYDYVKRAYVKGRHQLIGELDGKCFQYTLTAGKLVEVACEEIRD